MQPLISIDIETTGLEPSDCQIIELAAVVDLDGTTPIDDLPKFISYITYPVYYGEPYALQMHSQIFKEFASFSEEDLSQTDIMHVMDNFAKFLKDIREKYGNKRFSPAGKNYASFDKAFLERDSGFNSLIKPLLTHRTFDPGNLYWQPAIDGFVLPDTKTCLARAGLEPTDSHRALGDAIDVIRLIRAKMNK